MSCGGGEEIGEWQRERGGSWSEVGGTGVEAMQGERQERVGATTGEGAIQDRGHYRIGGITG